MAGRSGPAGAPWEMRALLEVVKRAPAIATRRSGGTAEAQEAVERARAAPVIAREAHWAMVMP